MIIWIIGLSGSGKTTLAKEVKKLAYKRNKNIVHIDGDEVRSIFQNKNYKLEGRKLNAQQIFKLCYFLDKNNINVVCSILSIFPKLRNKNRLKFKKYYEVFIDCDMEKLIKRDPKGIYKRFIKGKIKNVAGMDIKFPVPKNSNLYIKNDKSKKDLIKFAKKISRLL
tara:strand:+ start:150 stop:647 length:498 start_codon:yes stop_codon:yes gene_type:complete